MPARAPRRGARAPRWGGRGGGCRRGGGLGRRGGGGVGAQRRGGAPERRARGTRELCGSRLIGVVNEQAAALQRTSFTSIVREAGDLSAGVFDRRGYMVAQAVTGTPGHINSMALAMKHFLAACPLETLRPGDVLITNDPWLT